MKIVKRLLVILTTVSVISCASDGGRPIVWNPDFYAGDYIKERIVNEGGKAVSCDDPKLNEFGGMHYTKMKELADILREARLPGSIYVNGVEFDLSIYRDLKKNYVQQLDSMVLKLKNRDR